VAVLSEGLREKVIDMIGRYADKRSALLPLLYLMQAEQGYVTREGMQEAGEILGLTTAQVEAVASYYTMFKKQPAGKWVISVCTNVSCALWGAKRLFERAREALGEDAMGVTPDGLFTLEEVECLGACDAAPVLQINYCNYDKVTEEGLIEMIEGLRSGEAPAPPRGPKPVDHQATSRILAGLGGSGGVAGQGRDGAESSGQRTPRRKRETTVADFQPVLTARWEKKGADTIDGYVKAGGYRALRKAVKMKPAEVIEEIKASGLRGRGGAGFPTGLKWSFIPKDTGKPVYVVCNADEGEPGTFKDRELMERDPHQLIEGIAITSYAVGCHTAFIYMRGEFLEPARKVERAIREAYEKGFLGEGIARSKFDLDIVLHRGAGSYECGEETALLDSLEGKRGQPRLRPPFPAVEGLYRSPTVVNNVETLATVPHIVERGAEWFSKIGPEKSTGTKIFCVSGKVERPGNYEAPMGTPARVIIDELGGGVRDGKALKAWVPGGSSTPFLTADHLDTPMDFESIQAAGSLLGTGAVVVLDEDDCVVDAVLRWTQFYAHESCGKCTPCREGTWWLTKILYRFEHGGGRLEDIDVMYDVGDNMLFKNFCALGDGAVSPIHSSIKYFRNEYEEHVKAGGCPYEERPMMAAATAREGGAEGAIPLGEVLP
jgi:NADH-quinone oxidoreductase subunit F